jgi:hypothetical protein
LILGFLGIGEVVVVNVDRQGPSYTEANDYVEHARGRLLELAVGPPDGEEGSRRYLPAMPVELLEHALVDHR